MSTEPVVGGNGATHTSCSSSSSRRSPSIMVLLVLPVSDVTEHLLLVYDNAIASSS